MNTIERLFQYLDFKALKYAPTEKYLGLSNGYLGKMRARGASIGSEVIEKIVLMYRDINPEWLLTGKGDMLRSLDVIAPMNNGNAQLPEGPCNQCAIRIKLIAQQEETIELLKYKIDRLINCDNLSNKVDDIRQTG